MKWNYWIILFFSGIYLGSCWISAGAVLRMYLSANCFTVSVCVCVYVFRWSMAGLGSCGMQPCWSMLPSMMKTAPSTLSATTLQTVDTASPCSTVAHTGTFSPRGRSYTRKSATSFTALKNPLKLVLHFCTLTDFIILVILVPCLRFKPYCFIF